jgi:tetratricopeptide (TPR) repeat protein
MLLVCPVVIQAQQINIDSLFQESSHLKNDTLKMVYLRTISRIYAELNPDSAYYYSEKVLQLARQMNFKVDETSALREMGYALLNRSNYPRSLKTILSALAVAENPESEKVVLVGEFPGDDPICHRKASPHLQRLSEISFIHQVMGVLYANSNNYEKSKYHHLLARQYAEQSGNIPLLSIINLTLNRVYLNLKNTDSAMISITGTMAVFC